MDKNEELKFLLEIRLFYYSFLKSIFLSEPTKELLKLILQDDMIDKMPFKEESELIKEGYEEIADFFSNKDVLSDESFEELHWDYTRMFIGPYKLPAPPWESAYLNDERLLFQKETMEVRDMYVKYSFISENYLYEPDDHIGLELDFMSKLIELSIEAYEKSDEEKFLKVIKDEEFFLSNHLLKWCNGFSEDIINNSNTNFYKGIAKVLSGYLEFDCEMVKGIIKNL
ncbi:dehydrogenase [Clostridium carboxidivorans P7]|uniref:Cytoplasmic chaperone TorD family protein n=1 Tax=Clostridium carboxidivorans P7 TaxID=536227 RepID=C6PWT2_9CLOT|nr:molecular chaperone TorD family protein [Clostridium carboxidivorans]AKN31986.1 dehydrogenase [Clostridium carboxidivorans P7]EET86307.1 cytoplasmic chaperone TorD family protein [Clostridium carboxidivorans P7]EFG87879.1 cytoplasmic chaperone TorD [Clostridium carboxidivorans P7]